MLKEFKEFSIKGNMIDMSVGIIMGAAFGGVVGSIVKDLLSPILGILTGGFDFSNWFFALDGKSYANLAEATKAGAATLNFGLFVNVLISFTITAFAVFLLVKAVNAAKRKEAAAPTTPPSAEEKLLTEIRDLLARK